MKKQEFSVKVWNKVLKKFVRLPSKLKSYSLAQEYLKNHEIERAWCCKDLDYSNYVIQVRTVVYSDWEMA